MTTVPPKPNDPTIAEVTWAEGPKSAIEGSEDPRKPDQLSSGYGNQEPLRHAEFNWLFRAVMRWIRWLVSKVDFHVHDGLGTDASAPKVNASQHLDWGTNGTVTVTDTAALHEIIHSPSLSGSTKRITTGQLHAPTHVRTPTIQANGQGITAAVNVRDFNNANGFLDSAIVKTTNYLQTPTIRNAVLGGTINVRDSNNGNTTLNVQNLSTSTLLSNIIKNISNFRAIRVLTNADQRGFLDARNAPRAVALVFIEDSNVNFIARMGIETNNFGFSEVSKTNTGKYILNLIGPTDNKLAIFVTVNSNLAIYATSRVIIDNSQFKIEVLIRNSSGALVDLGNDSGFSIAIYDFNSTLNL